jgi:hypothetical protein
MEITYVPNPNAADGAPVIAEVVVEGTTVTTFAGPQPVIVMGGTVQTSVSFTGSVSTDIGSVEINDASGNFAVIPSAASAKPSSTKALVVQHIDDSGTPVREATQTSILAAVTALGATASATLNAQGTQSTSSSATAAGQAAGNATLTAILNNQGTQSTAPLTAIAANQSTSALQLVANAIATTVLNEMGTLATSANQVTGNAYLLSIDTAQANQATAANQVSGNASLSTIASEVAASNVTLSAILSNQGTESTAALLGPLIVTMNGQGTLATSALQTTGNTLASLTVNNQGTLATSALQINGNSLTTAVMNNQGTLATAVAQTAQLATVTMTMNNQGTLATAALQATGNAALSAQAATLSAVLNDMGTLATAAGQAATNNLLTVIMNDQGTQGTTLAYTAAAATATMNNQGTLATSANQAAQLVTATAILNNQGTQATSANQVTTNAYLLTLATEAPLQATAANQLALLNQQAAVIRTYGASGTLPTNVSSVIMGLDPSAVSSDAFGRLRVSTPDYRFDGQLTYGIPGDAWDQAWNSTGTVTWDSTNHMAKVTCAANGTSVMQSHQCGPYSPGRSQLISLSFILGSTPPYNTARRVGYYDSTSGNGVYLEQTPYVVDLTLASSTGLGNQVVNQSAWNIDRLDGTGPSGITFNPANAQIMTISMQALYSGRVLVGFDINGILWPVHQFTCANLYAYPYIANANLPVHFEARSTGTNTTSVYGICSSIVSEGGGSLSQIPARTFSVGQASSTAVTTRRPVLSIQPVKSFNGVPNTAVILPSTLSCYSNTVVYLEVVRNGVLTGASFNSVDSANSVANYDTAATAISGGSTLFSTLAGGGAQANTTPITSNLLDRLVIAYSQLTGTADTLSLVVTSTAGSAATYASLTWKELR